MKPYQTLRILTVAAAWISASAAQAAIIWTGAGANNNFFNVENWDLGDYTGPFASTTNNANAITTDVILNGATVNLGGTLLLAAGYTLTATDTQFNTADGLQGIFRSQGSASGEVTGTKAAFVLHNSTAYLGNVGTNVNLILDPSSALFLGAADGTGINTYSTVSLNPGASLTFANGSGVNGGTGAQAIAERILHASTGASFSNDYYGGEATLDYNAVTSFGPQTAFTLTGSDATPFGAADGAHPNGTFSITATAVPEPGAGILSLLGAAFLILRRHGRNRFRPA